MKSDYSVDFDSRIPAASSKKKKFCSICHDTIETELAVVLPCGHQFNPNCIAEWAVKSSKEKVVEAIKDSSFDSSLIMPRLVCPLCRDLTNRCFYEGNNTSNNNNNASVDLALRKFLNTLQLYITALYNAKLYDPFVRRMVERLMHDKSKFITFNNRVRLLFWDTQESLADLIVYLRSTSTILSEIIHNIMKEEEQRLNNKVIIDATLMKRVSVLEYQVEQLYNLFEDCRPYNIVQETESGEPKAYNDNTRLPVSVYKLKALSDNLSSRIDNLKIQDLLHYYMVTQTTTTIKT